MKLAQQILEKAPQLKQDSDLAQFKKDASQLLAALENKLQSAGRDFDAPKIKGAIAGLKKAVKALG